MGIILKSQMRTKILSQLKALAHEEKSRRSALIQSYLQHELQGETGIWVGYQNLLNEPSIDWSQISKKIEWAFLRVTGSDMEIRLNAKTFALSSLGVSEPTDGEKVALHDVQGVVMPGLAFDEQGFRLGRGAGYYDRYLNQFKNKKIGVCFGETFLKVLPREEHDIQCDVIITDKQIYHIHKTTQGVQQWN